VLDRVTQTLDREFFEYLLDLEVRKAVRYLYFFSLLIIQPDQMKKEEEPFPFSDDSLLKTFANLIRDEIRGTDIIGRIANNKFFLILHHADYQSTCQIGNRIKDRIQDYTFIVKVMERKQTISIGGASFPTHSNDIESLISKAEEMLEKARAEGGNLICLPQE
jgi:diguanylate cyclase (GGDEF)-like protein